MQWKKFLGELDVFRAKIRNDRLLTASIDPADTLLADLQNIITRAQDPTITPRAISLELDEDGNPIITPEIQALLQPQAATLLRPPAVIGRAAQAAPAPTAAMKVTPIPRTTPRVEHPISLEDASEETVIKE
jgi:hypothetical protein